MRRILITQVKPPAQRLACFFVLASLCMIGSLSAAETEVIQVKPAPPPPDTTTTTRAVTTTVVPQPQTTTTTIVPQPAETEKGSRPRDDWDVHIGFPLWAVGVSSEVNIGDRGAEVDKDFWDLFNHLDVIIPLNVEVRKSGWLFFANNTYTKSSSGAEPRGALAALVSDAQLVNKTYTVDFGLGYDVIPHGPASLEPYIGGRVISLKSTISADLPSADRERSDSQTWADPIIGLFFRCPINRPLFLFFEGDIGGFNISSSSDFTWQVNGGLEWDIGRWVYLRATYRHFQSDFEHNSSDFRLRMSGPQLEFGAHF